MRTRRKHKQQYKQQQTQPKPLVDPLADSHLNKRLEEDFEKAWEREAKEDPAYVKYTALLSVALLKRGFAPEDFKGDWEMEKELTRSELEKEAQAVLDGGGVFFQQFICAHCGALQTMSKPNMLFVFGGCQECGKDTDLVKSGIVAVYPSKRSTFT